MAKQKKSSVPGSALLPTVGKPGTYQWCEEVVECLNMAWRSKETAELAFLAAARAAVEFRIWETLSPAPPEEPYTSLEGLIRRTADGGQAENMQIAIRFSGILEDGDAPAEGGRPAAALPASSAAGTPPWEITAAVPGVAAAATPAGWQATPRPLTEDDEIALGSALLDRYAGQTGDLGSGVYAGAGMAGDFGSGVGLPTVEPPAPVSPKRTAAQRKRDKLDRTYPELAEAVDAGEMTLQQAYVEAGIEKANPNLDKLQRVWRSASPDERDRFLNWIGEQEGRERREAYHAEVYGEDEAA